MVKYLTVLINFIYHKRVATVKEEIIAFSIFKMGPRHPA